MSLTDAKIAAFDTPLVGHGLPATTLPALVESSGIVILHFLRHLGCLYCKQSVVDLHEVVTQSKRFPPLYFVHQSPVDVANAFFETHFPGAPHISDPTLKLYNLFGIKRLNPLQLFNPLQIAKGATAFFKGHRQTQTQGDDFVLSGTFLFFDGKLKWHYRANYAGDDPDWSRFSNVPAAS